MALSSFIKQLLQTDSLFGAKSKKLAGINDSALEIGYPTADVTIVDTTSEFSLSITTIDPAIPSWLQPNKYFLFDLPALPELPTTRLRVDSVEQLSDGYKIFIQRTAPGTEPLPTSFTNPVSVRLDGRIFAIIKDVFIAREATNGSTMFNLDSNISDGLEDGSGVAIKYASHYHAGGGGTVSGSCTVEAIVNTTSFGWDDSGSSDRNFSVDNTGFQWDLTLGQSRIIALCENLLLNPLPVATTGRGILEVSTITLDGTDIKSATSVDITTENTIKLNYNTRIAMPNLNQDQTFTIRLGLILKQEGADDVIVPEITRTLTYFRPSYEITLSRPTLNFSQNYITASVTRVFSRGAPATFVSTMIGTINQTPGTPTLSSFTYNINTSLADRTMTEVASFINVSNGGVSEDITQTAVIEPIFEFPVYLGSVETTTGLNTTIVNMFTQVGTFTSAPGSQNFSWTTDLAARDIKVFGILKTFHDGEINFKANSSSVVGNIQSPFATIATGANTLERQEYVYYEAQEGQPGAVTLFVEFLNG